MKLFISADIEGCAGVALTDETHKKESVYQRFAEEMTEEVVAACEAAHEAGADEIVVKDGHGDASNIDPLKMPEYVTLIRGKSGHPYNMMYGIDDSYDGVLYLGYHAPAGDPNFSISHTSTGNSLYIHLNGKVMSECMLNSYTAASHHVPVLFLSGDEEICRQAKELIPGITTVETKHGVGAATWCKAKEKVISEIREGALLYIKNINLTETQRKEDKTMDIEMFGKLSDAFGPSGFEEDVIRTIADYCKEFDVENDAMNNLYVRMPGTKQDSRPVIQLDAHLDACGFMVQNIQDNGCLGIIMLGGFHLTSLPAHAVWIRTRSGKMVHGIICAKPVHFMTTAERSSQTLEIEKMYVDVGATSREEVENVFGIHIGDPMMPDVTFEYDAEHEICFGKAFDNRAGCACIVDTMKQLEKEQASLAVNVVGAFAAQEEVGTRGAVVTSQIVKPDLAIVFEGSPSDDFFISAGQAQGCMKKGVQIRILDNSYISNTQFISLAEEVAEKCGIKYQESVRRGGSTNAAKISVTGKAVPCLVLGVPSRYAHSHYNFCAKEDLEAASAMAANVIRALDEEKIRHICHQDVL